MERWKNCFSDVIVSRLSGGFYDEYAALRKSLRLIKRVRAYEKLMSWELGAILGDVFA